jgi:hypothetical protein
MWSHTTGRYVAAFEEGLTAPIREVVFDSLASLLHYWLLMCPRTALGLLTRRSALPFPCHCGISGPGPFGLRGLLVL